MDEGLVYLYDRNDTEDASLNRLYLNRQSSHSYDR